MIARKQQCVCRLRIVLSADRQNLSFSIVSVFVFYWFAFLFCSGQTASAFATQSTTRSSGPIENDIRPAQDVSSIGSTLEEGDLQKIQKSLRAVFRLRWKQDTISIDRANWKDSAKKVMQRAVVVRMGAVALPDETADLAKLFVEIGTRWGQRSMSGGSSGNVWHRSFTSASGSGEIRIRPGLIKLELTEASKPSRCLSYRDSLDGNFSITVFGGKTLLIIDQQSNGKIRLVFDVGNGVKAMTENSFRDFAVKHSREFVSELLPLLQHFGIVPPLMPQDRIVVNAVHAQLKILEGIDESKFEELCSKLNSKQFSDRESATNEINDNYELYLSLITARLNAKDTAPEVRSRLMSVIAANSKSNEIADLIRSFQLTESPSYLLTLLKQLERTPTGNPVDSETGKSAKSKANLSNIEIKRLISQRLQKLTGQEFGEDIQRWEAWIDRQKEDAAVESK